MALWRSKWCRIWLLSIIILVIATGYRKGTRKLITQYNTLKKKSFSVSRFKIIHIPKYHKALSRLQHYTQRAHFGNNRRGMFVASAKIYIIIISTHPNGTTPTRGKLTQHEQQKLLMTNISSRLRTPNGLYNCFIWGTLHCNLLKRREDTLSCQ